jgi:uncharacterized membrane protein
LDPPVNRAELGKELSPVGGLVYSKSCEVAQLLRARPVMISPSRFDRFEQSKPGVDIPPEVKTEDGVDPLAPLKKHAAELAEFVQVYLAVQSDSIRNTLRTIGLYAALGLVGGIALIALIAKATTMLLAGAAAGLGELLGDRLWAGELIVAAVVLAVIAITVYLVMNKITNTSRQKAARKYEQRRESERAKFGVDYQQRAKEPVAQ